jgi:hypothetical protein
MKPLIEDKENVVNNTFSHEKGRAKTKLTKKKSKPLIKKMRKFK